MSTHLSKSQLERFSAGALKDDELSACALHVADCQECHKEFVEELRRQYGSGPFTFSLDLEFWFRHDHLEFEDLVRIADQTLESEPELKEIFDAHLRTCKGCREDVRSFLAYRKLEDEGNQSTV